MQVIEHPLPMRELLFVQDPVTRGLLTCKRRPWRSRCFSEPARPGTVHFSTVTLEAERVVAIGTDDAAVSKPRLPVAASLAEMFGGLGSLAFGAGHVGLLSGHDIERP